FLFPLLPAPPPLPLFPYTTLFRSWASCCEDSRESPPASASPFPATTRPSTCSPPESPATAFARRRRQSSSSPRPSQRRAYLSPRDRKSTRLNSSHLGISYAVFCLK